MVSRIVGLPAVRLLAAAMVAAALSACGGDGPDPLPGGVASLTVAPTGDIRLAVGVTAQVSATPKDASGNTVSEAVTWSSTNTAVATVASTGATTATVTGTGVGAAIIRAAAGSIVQDINVIVGQPQFNVRSDNACSNPDMRNYKVETQTEHLLIVSDLGNPAGGFTSQDYAAIAAEFESLVWPILTANFGAPADIDGNGKVIAFYTRAVNELTPENSQSVVGGFFFGRDLFPKVASGRFSPGCPSSNEAEMFYMLVPDPNGEVNRNIRSVTSVRNITVGVLGHEFQHLINSSRRLYINQAAMWPETSYMEEGLSHIAEELIFYEASGMTPRTNINLTDIRATAQRTNAFNSYMASNAGRFRNYLRTPHNNSPYQRDDDLETRGAIWAFLRYLADRGTPGTPFAETECTYPVALTVGAKCEIETPEAQQFAVSGGTGGEFTIVAFAKDLATVPGTNPPTAGSLTVDATASSTITAVGPPVPWVGGGSASLSTLDRATLGASTATLTLDDTFHARLRRLERRDLPQRVAGARAAWGLRNRTSARMYSAAQAGPSMSHFAVEPVWSQLVNSNDTGMVNLRGRFGQDISGAAQDWAVAHYVDDIGLPGVPAQWTHPSWNFRSFLPVINADVYPLAVDQLGGSTTTKVLADGGAAYYRFGLAPAASSTVRFTVGGAAPPANLKLVIVRTK